MPRRVINTVFPAVPKTVWKAGDPDLEWLAGEAREGHWHVEKQNSLVLRGPHIDLDTGLYGVEFQLSLVEEQPSSDLPVAHVQITSADGGVILAEETVLAGQLDQHFAGMYQGVRPDVLVEQPIQDVEFSISALGKCPFFVRGVKLIPRPGQIWFAADLDCTPTDWEFAPNRSAQALAPTLLGGPGISLPSGDYRLGYKLKAPAEVSEGQVAAIDVIGVPADKSATEIPAEQIVEPQPVTAEQLRAHGGVPDAKLRFRLDRPYRDLQFRLDILSPGLIMQWLRCATADEATWHHYYHLGGGSSPLGHPLTAFLPLDANRREPRAFQRHFEHGALYYTQDHGPCEVYGPMYQEYQDLGGPLGELGVPASRPRAIDAPPAPARVVQSFEGGEMTWHRDGRARAIEVISKAVSEQQ